MALRKAPPPHALCQAGRKKSQKLLTPRPDVPLVSGPDECARFATLRRDRGIRLQRQFLTVIEVSCANCHEVCACHHPPNVVQELTAWLSTDGDEVQIFLHLLHLRTLRHVRRT